MIPRGRSIRAFRLVIHFDPHLTYWTCISAFLKSFFVLILGLDQAKLFKHKKKYFNNSSFLRLGCYFCYQKRAL
jgi:hypothetical protein